MEIEVTAEEMKAVREYLNAQQRAWWNKQTPEQRRERRLRYQIRMMKKAAEAAKKGE